MHRNMPAAELILPDREGRLGLLPCPGSGRAFAQMRGEPDPLLADLEDLAEWGAVDLITLMEAAELAALGLTDLETAAESAGMRWHHLPIADFGAPEPRFERSWMAIGPTIQERLKAGQNVALHCYAGLGRTGTIAARVLIEAGLAPAAAIDRVRQARPGSIQSFEQERYLLDTLWKIG